MDHGTFAIDRVLNSENGAWWDTIDKVRHVGPDGRMHSYSSKPVLWPTLLAGQYWLIQQWLGWTLETELFGVVRLMLAINNLICLALFIWSMGRIAERLSTNVAARAFVTASAAVGTHLTTFAVTLNNHLPAAAVVALTIVLVFRLTSGRASWIWFFMIGLLATFAATLELPAASWLAVCAVVALRQSVSKTLTGFVPAVTLVAGSMIGLNFIAHGDWRTPYAHRSDGPVIASVEGDFASDLDDGRLPRDIADAIQANDANSTVAIESATVVRREGAMFPNQLPQWIVNEDQPGQYVVEQTESEDSFDIRQWNNWYDYPGSYWRSNNRRKSTVDLGERNRAKYLLHITVGHHGFLSLTPIFLLSLFGVIPLCISKRRDAQWFALAGIAISIVVVAFYVRRSEIDRNYGGMTSGLRWVFWLYPFWLAWMTPVLETANRRRVVWWLACLLLVLSVASAQYSADNPWVHPWLYEWMSLYGYEV